MTLFRRAGLDKSFRGHTLCWTPRGQCRAHHFMLEWREMSKRELDDVDYYESGADRLDSSPSASLIANILAIVVLSRKTRKRD